MEYIRQFAPDVIHSCYYSFLEPGTLEQLKRAGYFISYDYTEEWKEEDFPNKAPYVDIAFLSCPLDREGDVKAILKKIVLDGAKMAVMTLGAKGSVLYDGREFYEQEAYRVEPVDTMGAGDSLTILITHRLGAARMADEILVLDQGRIMEQGTHKALTGLENGLYREMFESQRCWYEA